MARESKILDKLKRGQMLTPFDQAQVYLANLFIAPGSDTKTTLLHQIILLPNAIEILSTLDTAQLSTPMSTDDETHNDPLGSMISTIISQGAHLCDHAEVPEAYKEAICFLVNNGAYLDFIRYQLLEDYRRPDIWKIIEECDAFNPHGNSTSITHESLALSGVGADGVISEASL